MPRLTAAQELAAAKAEAERLTEECVRLSEELIAIDKKRHPISLAFSEAWQRRDRCNRRIMELERKVKVCKPSKGESHPASKKKEAAAILAALKPAELQALLKVLAQKANGTKEGGKNG